MRSVLITEGLSARSHSSCHASGTRDCLFDLIRFSYSQHLE